MQHHRFLSAAFAAAFCVTALNALAEEPASAPEQKSSAAEAVPEAPSGEGSAYVKYQGSIVSVDAAAKTVTVKTNEGMEIVLDVTAETKFRGDEATMDLSTLKSGEAVRGMYHDVEGKLLALSIRTGSKVAPPKKEKEKPAEEASGVTEE